MNLHAIVAPYVGSVNPMVPALVRISTGPGPIARDGTRQPTYATPGAFTGAITGTVLTVSAQTAGKLAPGQAIAGTGVPTGSAIASLGTGTGGLGTYNLNKAPAAPISAEAMTSSLTILGQVQPFTWRDLQQLEGLNLNGDRRGIYVSGDLNGVVRVTLKGGDLITLPDASVWLVVQQLEGWNLTAGWTKAAIVLQNGS